MVTVSAVRIKRFTGDIGNFPGKGLRTDCLGIHSSGKSDPHEDSSIGMCRTDALRKILSDCFSENISSFAIQSLDRLHMFVQIKHFHVI